MVVGAMACCLAPTVDARAAGRTSYVARNGRDTSVCDKADPCRTINRAIESAAGGDTIIVTTGTYRQGVIVDKRVAIVGRGRPVVDAKGRPNGFLLEGAAADGASVEGFRVERATFEGILARQTAYVTIAHNVVRGNDLGRNARHLVGECAAQQPASGPAPGPRQAVVADLRKGGCGEGLHLLATTNSRVIGNVVSGNAGGIYLTDDLGPTAHNLISHNQVSDNRVDCGITLASHSQHALSPAGAPQPSVGGIYDNVISANVADRNGLRRDGSGILLAAAFAGGGAYDNLVLNNTAVGNSHPGINIHSHARNQDLNGNVLVGNVIGRNAINGGPNGGPGDVGPGVTHTTGILIWSAFKPITGTVIVGNRITNNYFGVWTRLVIARDRAANIFRHVRFPVYQAR
jgi:parallel beta-helix repeat protein